MKEIGTGDSFGRYRIEELLGTGGMGRVFAARDTVLRRRMAIKLLHGADSTAGAALLREARAAAAMSHPNAVAIFDVGEHDGVPFIAMELLDGRPLRAFIGDATVTMDRKLRWLGEVARALGAAHAAGLVHRDIKPGNVIVTRDDSVKVLDFGIAKRTGDLGEDMTLDAVQDATVEGNVKGTPRYMAPEQLMGEVDARVDQFAWGVLAYEILCGVHPWSTFKPDSDLAAIIASRDPPPPRTLNPLIAESVERVVARAMQKRPEARFGTMEELARELAPPGDPTVEATEIASARGAEPAVGPSGSRTRIARVGAVVLAGAAVAGLSARWLSHPAPIRATPVASAAPAPTPVMSLPRPRGTSSEAMAAWLSGMQAMHDAANSRAERELSRALALDPSETSTILELMILNASYDPSAAHEYFERARAMRSTMSEHDQAVLDAYEPYVARSPADATEHTRRLRAVAARYPLDAHVLVDLAVAEGHSGDLGGSATTSGRALAIDPEFGQALAIRAMDRAYMGDFAGAESDTDACLRAAPAATPCRVIHSELLVRRLGCSGVEPDARAWIQYEPSSAFGFRLLASVGVTRGDSSSTVHEALAQAFDRDHDDARKARATAALAVLQGDFVTGGRTARAWLSSVSTAAASDHGQPLRALGEMLDETGHPAEAGRLGEDFLTRSLAWSVPTQGEDVALQSDATPTALAMAARGGQISREAEWSRFAQWVSGWRARLTPFYVPYLWAYGWARMVATPDDATRALAALQDFGGKVPPYLPYSLADADIGRTYLLAGHPDDAIPYLERASQSCAVLSWPTTQTRSLYDLGLAYAQSGDRQRACAALRRVTERWGAVPTSITGKAARARSRELGCPGG